MGVPLPVRLWPEQPDVYGNKISCEDPKATNVELAHHAFGTILAFLPSGGRGSEASPKQCEALLLA